MTPPRPALAQADPLDELAYRANAEHRAYEAAQSAAIAHAIAAGQALIAAKAEVGHGHWLAWVRTSLDFSEDTAEIYIRIARNSERVRNLPSVRAALAELAEPRVRVRPEPSRQAMWRRLAEVIDSRPAWTATGKPPDPNLDPYEPIGRRRRALEVLIALGRRPVEAGTVPEALRRLADEIEGFGS
jgi:hypothetical protein